MWPLQSSCWQRWKKSHLVLIQQSSGSQFSKQQKYICHLSQSLFFIPTHFNCSSHGEQDLKRDTQCFLEPSEISGPSYRGSWKPCQGGADFLLLVQNAGVPCSYVDVAHPAPMRGGEGGLQTQCPHQSWRSYWRMRLGGFHTGQKTCSSRLRLSI